MATRSKKVFMNHATQKYVLQQKQRKLQKFNSYPDTAYLYQAKNVFSKKRLVIKAGQPNQRIIARCKFIKELKIKIVSSGLVYSGDPNLDYYAYTADKTYEILMKDLIDTNTETYFMTIGNKMTENTLKEDIYVINIQNQVSHAGERAISTTLTPLDSMVLGDNTFFEIKLKDTPYTPKHGRHIAKIKIKTDNWLLNYFDTGDAGDELINAAPFKLTIGKDNAEKFTFNNTWANNRYLLPLSAIWKGTNEAQSLREYFPEDYAWFLILRLLTLSYNVKVNWNDVKLDIIKKAEENTDPICEYWSNALQNRQPTEIASKLNGLIREEFDLWSKGRYSTYFFYKDDTHIDHTYKWGKIVNMKTHPSKEELRKTIDKVKAFCVMLARDICSPFSIQGGLNDYHGWLLPYMLQVVTVPSLDIQTGGSGMWFYKKGADVKFILVSSHIDFNRKLPKIILDEITWSRTYTITGSTRETFKLVNYAIAAKPDTLAGIREWRGLLYTTNYKSSNFSNEAIYTQDQWADMLRSNSRVVATYYTPYPPAFDIFSWSGKWGLPGSIESKITLEDIRDRGYFVCGKITNGNTHYNQSRTLSDGIINIPRVYTLEMPLRQEILSHINNQSNLSNRILVGDIEYNYDLIFNVIPYWGIGATDVYIRNISYKLTFRSKNDNALIRTVKEVFNADDKKALEIITEFRQPVWISSLRESYKQKLYSETIFFAPVLGLNMGEKITENLNNLQPNEITQIFVWVPYKKEHNLLNVMSIIQNPNYEVINGFKPIIDNLHNEYEIMVVDKNRTSYKEIKLNHVLYGDCTLSFIDNEGEEFFSVDTIVGNRTSEAETETTLVFGITEEAYKEK